MGTIQKLVNLHGNVKGYEQEHKICETLESYKAHQVPKYKKNFLDKI